MLAIRVATRVRGGILDAGGDCRRDERPPDPGVAESVAHAVGDDEIPVGGEGRGEAALAEQVSDFVHHDHVSASGVGLEWDALTLTAHLIADSDHLLLEVDVLPVESHEFCDPEALEQKQRDDQCSRPPCVSDEALDLGVGEEPVSGPAELRTFPARQEVGRVRGDETGSGGEAEAARSS